MTERKRWHGARPVAMAAAALALSGCAATHVGEDWQCPIAQSEVCTSVADADPAVREARETEPLAPHGPLYRPRGENGAAGTAAAAPAGPGCESDCGPLAWLGRLFDRLAGDGAGGAPSASMGTPDMSAAMDDAAASPPPPVDGGAAEAVDVAAASSPAAGLGGAPRAPEVLGRVWIAPFVDAGGIYREGAWVRLVIEPARWRLP